jgi:phosphopantetheinyl transferase
MTRAGDRALAGRSTRLDVAFDGVDLWCVELDRVHHGARNRDVVAPLLARSLQCEPASIAFRQDGWGKPHLVGHPNVHVNVSRSQSHMAVAIGPRAIGVDIEVVRPVAERRALGTLHLTPSEHAQVLAADEDRRDELFLLAWTRKEACAKAIGAGLRIPPSAIPCGVDRGVASVSIPFQGSVHIVDVQSRFTAGAVVVSCAVLQSRMPTP